MTNGGSILQVNLTLNGKTPIILNNIDLADPEYKYTKMRGEILDKPAKYRTQTDQAALERLEWEGSLYLDEDDRIIFPLFNISRSLQRAGMTWRLGTKITNGVTFDTLTVPLQYDGPADLTELYENPAFRFRKMVNKTPTGVKPSMVVCVRPRFNRWSITFTAVVQTDVLDEDDFFRVLTVAGNGQGIGNGRRLGFGMFSHKVNWRKEV